MFRRLGGSAALAALSCSLSLLCLCAAEPTPAERVAADRVRDAQRAELAGKDELRADSLAVARKAAPSYGPAQWHAGFVQVGKKWLPVTEVQQQAAADKRLDDYSLQRAIADDSAGQQLALAMWCRQHGLVEQERLHLKKTLLADPSNAEAARRLGVTWVQGQWLTAKEIAAQQEADRTANRNWYPWSPRIREWRTALEGKDPVRISAARQELLAVTDPAAIPALEKLLSSRSDELAQEVVAVLTHIPDQQATESLLRHVVVLNWAETRYAALNELKRRSRYDYVPQLLSGLAMPVEMSVAWSGDTFVVSFFKETADATYQVVRGQTISRFVVFGRYQSNLNREHKFLVDPVKRLTTDPKTYLGRTDTSKSRTETFGGQAVGATPAESVALQARAAELKAQVDNYNSRAGAMNQRLAYALSNVTGQKYSDDPRHWWAWWLEWNETHAPDKPCHTDYYHQVATYSAYMYETWMSGSQASSYTLSKDPPPGWNVPPKVRRPLTSASCFAAGTPVWAERGLTPIEQIRPGDRVLSQDQDTGELRFQAVLATTIRPESPLLQIGNGDDAIRATRGHPFCVAGQGWQMAKNLKTGDLLHGLHGSSRIEALSEAQPERAYNLVVDDFDTYFVGRRGLLVHDNVIRKPTPCVLPGFKKSDLAEAGPMASP